MSVVESIPIARRETMVEAIAKALIQYIADKGLGAGDRLPSERELVQMVGGQPAAFARGTVRPQRARNCRVAARPGRVRQATGPGCCVRYALPLATHAGGDRHQAHFRGPVCTWRPVSLNLPPAAGRTTICRALQDAQQGMIENIDIRPEYVRYDMAFHLELARSTDNPIFHVFMASVTDLLQEVQYLYVDDVEVRRLAAEEHEQILEAVAQRERQASSGPHANPPAQRNVPNVTAGAVSAGTPRRMATETSDETPSGEPHDLQTAIALGRTASRPLDVLQPQRCQSAASEGAGRVVSSGLCGSPDCPARRRRGTGAACWRGRSSFSGGSGLAS